jgi:hypothetical protein
MPLGQDPFPAIEALPERMPNECGDGRELTRWNSWNESVNYHRKDKA